VTHREPWHNLCRLHRFCGPIPDSIAGVQGRGEPGRLTISAVSTTLGIPVPTIRSWERRYRFPSPDRTQGRHRRYSTHEVELLRQLRDEITRGHPAARGGALILARGAGGGVPRTRYLDDFLTSAMRLDPGGLRQALDGAAESLGVETAIRDVALPAMREMGSRWVSGDCDIAPEHLATESVRVWLAHQSAMVPRRRSGPTHSCSRAARRTCTRSAWRRSA